MTVKEYREKYPHCRFCKYGNRNSYDPGVYCRAKKKGIILNRARFCPIFSVEENEYDYR